MFKLKIVSFDFQSIKKVEKCLRKINVVAIPLPKKIKKITVLKSPHVNNKSKEHFSLVQYKRICYLKNKKAAYDVIVKLPQSVAIRLDYSGNGAAW